MIEGMDNTVQAVEFTRWYLAIFFVCVSAFYIVRILVMKRRMHRSPVYAGSPGTLHFATHTTFRVFRILILAVCVVRLPWPALDRYLMTLEFLWHPFVLMLGNAMLLVGFFATLGIHVYMGENWRSGTRDDDQTPLITTGPFAISQNPMMLCVIVAQIGLFLALPTIFTLVCLIVGVLAVSAQVDVERRSLERRFGDIYEDYTARTPRWLIFR